MKFFNIDLHISVIEDIKTIFNDLGHQVDSKCMSSHTWVFGRSRDRVDIIGPNNWSQIDKKMCDAFYERYKDELSEYDGFIVTHTPCFSLLYEKFNKPIITVASTRYEAPFTDNKEKWDKFNDFLVNKIDEGMIIPITNNLYDKKYCEYFTNREWNYISSLCEYTNLKYTGNKDAFLFYDTCYTDIYDEIDQNDTAFKAYEKPNIIEPSQLKDKSWQNIYDHKAIIHIPYNISTMSIFEQYTANIPLILPSLKYMIETPGTLSQLYYSNLDPKDDIELSSKDSISLADYYQFEEILYFDQLWEIDTILKITDFKSASKRMEVQNERRKREVLSSWKKTLNKIL